MEKMDEAFVLGHLQKNDLGEEEFILRAKAPGHGYSCEYPSKY